MLPHWNGRRPPAGIDGIYATTRYPLRVCSLVVMQVPSMSADLLYRIDAADRLCHVNEAWEAFARDNSGEDFGAERVLGRSLWSYVRDLTIAQVYRQIITDARHGRDVRLRFRCDAPRERRLLEMTVRGTGSGVVQFSTHLVAVVARPPEALFDASTPRAGMPVRVCSWCNRVWVGDRWLEVEQAVERMHLMLRSVLPPLAHAACKPCLDIIMREVDGLAGDRPACWRGALLFSVGESSDAMLN